MEPPFGLHRGEAGVGEELNHAGQMCRTPQQNGILALGECGSDGVLVAPVDDDCLVDDACRRAGLLGVEEGGEERATECLTERLFGDKRGDGAVNEAEANPERWSMRPSGIRVDLRAAEPAANERAFQRVSMLPVEGTLTPSKCTTVPEASNASRRD